MFKKEKISKISRIKKANDKKGTDLIHIPPKLRNVILISIIIIPIHISDNPEVIG